jgi:NAD(P)-dependent dehydrogenase (short-subunit alcohol dehydrogenase family)
MEKLFANKVAFITGGAAGMGLAAVKAFAEEGAAVAIVDNNESAAKSVANELLSAGHKAIAVRCDVSDEAEVEAAVDATVSAFGSLDAAFNNAGIQSPATELPDLPTEEYRRILGVNLDGVFFCMKYELLQMRKQGAGAIVNNSSLGGLVGVPGRAAYHATKHGVLGLTKSAALEYAERGIRINAVCPGIIDTPMVSGMLKNEPGVMQEMMRDVPARRLGTATEVANAVVWLCSSKASFVTGQALAVDGGYTAR